MYSNALRVRADDIELPIGTLRFSTGHERFNPLVIEAIDRLDAVNPDGSQSWHIATDGDELIGDVAYVVSFALNVVVTGSAETAGRVIGRPGGRGGPGSPEHLLRRTFDPSRFVTDKELEDVRRFCSQLLNLQRSSFEAAMRAVRRIVDASMLVADDPTLAYTLYVAALESLSGEGSPMSQSWDEYDGRKRKVIDTACSGLEPRVVERIREAVLQVDQYSIRRRFLGFINDHVAPSFYREEARGTLRPIRSAQLTKALDFAYQVRSRSMHSLRTLAPELWSIADCEDTIWHDDRPVLTLEGLNRLSRHVIRQYVRRAPTGVDEDFKSRYRASLPGQVQMRLAPQLWVGSANSFSAAQGPAIFNALVEMVIATRRGEKNSIVDMARPLERIEHLLSGEAKQVSRIPLIATYVLWNTVVPERYRRPKAVRYLERYSSDLDSPSVAAYVVGLLTGNEPPWSTEQLRTLVDDREAELARAGAKLQELPERVDAAMRLGVAYRLWTEDDRGLALDNLARAVELLPGDEYLLAVEEKSLEGAFSEPDLLDFIIGKSAQEVAQEGEAAAAEPEAPGGEASPDRL
ncbi:hypothetical protein ACP3TD_11610 [Pseudarthrobacter sp. 1G09]|uniref:hypothetical protein n=1 Tax=Pseudarthrobacter sp. 1G09 TaxID=3416178 RepID=UPI003CF23BE7